MKTILVPIGSEKSGVSTLQYAIDLASNVGASVYAIKAFGAVLRTGSLKKFDDVLEADAKTILNTVLQKTDKKGVQVIAKTVKGDITGSIERIARQLNVDLIVGTFKIKKDSRVFLGKIAANLIKNTNVPVLFIPYEYTFKPVNKILMAIKSGYIANPKVLEPVQDIKNSFNATLDLLQVYTPDVRANDKNLNENLDKIKDSLTTTENATIFQGILEHINHFTPDLIFVIRRKRGFFARLWQKGRVYKKDFESRIPLLVLKVAE
ncbi:MAG: universal stress protein UspA [Flavobacteriales bacterium]|nr:MAG: universal stress protein UspA [Flavobacteriales bacterium]PIE49490.1 MAG: universal stress protein UspA [Flavobacteriales bacterium]